MGFLKTEEELTFSHIVERIGDLNHYQAKNLLSEFGDLDTLETAHAEEVIAVPQIGPKTIENIGIWDENGDPVESIPRTPCAVCGAEYTHYMRFMGDGVDIPVDSLPDSTVPWTACAEDSFSGGTLYFHESA
jgi:hypothetical protein